ncbi:MAG: VanZ family protein [bacterium]|nr:VanZ family protein [bacterium]
MALFLIDKLCGAVVALPLIIIYLFICDRKRLGKKWVWAGLFAIYMQAMLVIVGIPDFRYRTWDPTVNMIPFRDFSTSNVIGMALNLLMFVPFGVFLPVYFERFRKMIPAVFAGVVMSLTLEIIQLFSFRTTDVDDLIMNTLGAFVGFMIAKLLFKKSQTGKADKDVRKLVVMIAINVLIVIFVRTPLLDVFLQIVA